MKRIPLTLLGLLLGIGALSRVQAGMLDWIVPRKADWSFIQSTGGLRILPPMRDDGKLVLPVVYDASGSKAVTCPPTTADFDPALVVEKIKVTRSGKQIFLRLYTMPVKDQGSTEGAGLMHYADLSGTPAGSYVVCYGAPDGSAQTLGRVEIK